MSNLHPVFDRICRAFGAPVSNGHLHDKGTDRLLADIGVEPEPVLRESVRLTKELWPERGGELPDALSDLTDTAARLAADKNAEATARPFGVPYRSARTDAALSIDASRVEEVERFDEFTGPLVDESGASAGGGVA